VSYIRSAGSGEVEEEPRGGGFQRGIGHLISCPYCMAPWCATALSFGLLFAPRVTRFFAGILVSVTVSDFLHRAYARMKQEKPLVSRVGQVVVIKAASPGVRAELVR